MNEATEHDAYFDYLVLCLARLRDEGKEVHFMQVCATQSCASFEVSGTTVNRIVPGTKTVPENKKYHATFVSRPRTDRPKPEPKVEDDEPEFTEELLEAYRNAEYAVFAEPEFVLRIGEYSQQLESLLASEEVASAAFITAYNPKSEPFADKWNTELGMFLEHDVLIKGFSSFHGEGRDSKGGWKPEQSLLITGITQAEANGLAKKYDQNAFVFVGEDAVPELVLTSEGWGESETGTPDRQHGY